MHALLPLLAALQLASAKPATPAPTQRTGRGLAIVRGECTAIEPPDGVALRVLGYHEACGPEWRRHVTSEALGALASGDGVALWRGVPGLGALCASARSLQRASPAPCARAAAVSRAASRLCVGLRVRRVVLTPSPPLSFCAVALSSAESALRGAGLQLHHDVNSTFASLPLSYAFISCPSIDDTQMYVGGVLGDFVLTIRVRVDVHGAKAKRSRVEESKYDEPSSSAGNRTEVTKNGLGFLKLLFLFDDERALDATTSTNRKRVYDFVTRELDRQIEAEKVGKEEVNSTLRIFQWVNETWHRVGAIETTSTRSLDGYDDWSATIADATDGRNWEQWVRGHALAAEDGDERAGEEAVSAEGSWRTAVALAAGGAAVAGAGAAAARVAQRRRRARRRRGDVVLDARAFAFPSDSPRRVGDGMEAMLSCWLQQLHEFGGPELDRPDLLKRAPKDAAAPSQPPAGAAPVDRRVRYKGDAVHLKRLPTASLELRSKGTDVLLVMHSLRHENLNPFIGCLCEMRPSLAFDHCGRGSLEDVLVADDIKLDWTFRLSLLTDLVKGLRYLHGSALRVHGRLSSRNCVVDSRWVLRITDYGLPEFYRAQALVVPPRSARDLLWTAPELLRENRGEGRGTQPGDIFSFAIVMQEVIVRGEPYCMLALSPEEIVEKLMRPPPLIRPSVSMAAAPPEAVSVMRQCWAETPDLRPDTDALLDIFRHLHRGGKINIVDSMFEMLEKYSNNLEELIRERTEQLDMEKKKTEQLLNRMLPRSVAERLLLGLRVEPEEFEEVTVYFSDIVGFTALAARSTPVQVVALLNDLYTTFDAAIERYHVYKVETIGDAYMVVGGLPVRADDHAQSVATMALHLLHLAGRFRVRHLPRQPLHLRIGLHSGPCCAGVVGLTMPRYCLFGDTVNTASRMESTGAAWRIQTSEATAALLRAAGGYLLRERGLTHVKGKGAMRTFWLLGKEGFDKPLPTPPPLKSEEADDVLVELQCPSPLPSPPSEHPAVAVAASRSQPEPVPSTALPSFDPSAHYARYRCLGGGSNALRRQWSLERGDAMAAACAGAEAPAAPLAVAFPRAPRPPRYRLRPLPPPSEAPS